MIWKSVLRLNQCRLAVMRSDTKNYFTCCGDRLLTAPLFATTVIPSRSSSFAPSNEEELCKNGKEILLNPDVNKGLAFTDEERQKYKLKGLLPAGFHTQAYQVKLAIQEIRNLKTDLHRYLYMRDMQDFNKRLFYQLVVHFPDELMPIIYTPVVGEACSQYSQIYKRPRGMFITINDAGKIEQLFRNWGKDSIKALVVTDGERILGLGDLGANGMGISVGKMALYSAIGGIPPHLTIPVCLDVGTNNKQLLNDPFYIGLHKKRVEGKEYDDLIDEFMNCVVKLFGEDCLIQFEDFGNKNARRLLEKYRNNYCTFNDDIQGTASVALAGIFASTRVTGLSFSKNVFLFQGAGTAALGIAELIIKQMMHEGLSEQDAADRIWFVDIDGVVNDERKSELSDVKQKYAKNIPSSKNLEKIIKRAKPSCIIGASAVSGAFTPSILKFMAEINPRPVIFALSNPTIKSECTAEEAYQYTNGTCVFASGSPFAPVEIDGKIFEANQGNNVYIFPAIALAVMACRVKRISDEAFIQAAKALSESLTEEELQAGRVYPRLKNIHKVTLNIAARLTEWFYRNDYSTYSPEPSNKHKFLKRIQYNPNYDSTEK